MQGKSIPGLKYFLVTQKAQVRLLPLKTLLQVDVRCGKDYKSITDQYSVIFLETITNNCFCPKGYTL
jgi:hypothetical protein